MNWYAFKNTLYYKKNKIFAVGFSGLALLLLLAYHALSIMQSGWAHYFDDVLFLISTAFEIIVYMIIFVCNLRNDPYAYNGIMMFVFYITFDAIFYSLGPALGDVASTIALGEYMYLAMSILMAAFVLMQAIFGVLLYFNTRRYAMGFYGAEFSKIRKYGIIWAIGVVGSTAMTMTVLYLSLGYFVLTWLLTMIGEASMAVAICFTLERLKR